MAGLFDKQSDVYLNTRPTYPSEWFSKLSALTPRHNFAWDVGTGNGQAALGVAEHYKKVIATDVSKPQLQNATPHPRIQYLHTPVTMSSVELTTSIGGKNSIDLITVAQAVHWFDLPTFYSLCTRLLHKPDGIIAVWGYSDQNLQISPSIDPIMKRFFDTTLPFWNEKIKYLFDGYEPLPFPFESVGLGKEREPLRLEIEQKVSFDGFVGMLRSWSAVNAAKEKGVDLLNARVVKEFESAWGGFNVGRSVVHKAFMLVGKVRI